MVVLMQTLLAPDFIFVMIVKKNFLRENTQNQFNLHFDDIFRSEIWKIDELDLPLHRN